MRKREQQGVLLVMARRDVDYIHVETDLGVVNIYLKLVDRLGRRVENVQMVPNPYPLDSVVRVRGSRFVELKGGKRT